MGARQWNRCELRRHLGDARYSPPELQRLRQPQRPSISAIAPGFFPGFARRLLREPDRAGHAQGRRSSQRKPSIDSHGEESFRCSSGFRLNHPRHLANVLPLHSVRTQNPHTCRSATGNDATHRESPLLRDAGQAQSECGKAARPASWWSRWRAIQRCSGRAGRAQTGRFAREAARFPRLYAESILTPPITRRRHRF